VVVHLIDAASHIASEGKEGTAADKRSAEDTETIIENLKDSGQEGHPGAQQDRRHAPRHPAGPVAQKLFDTGVYSEVYMISAADRRRRRRPEVASGPVHAASPWLYPEDQSADVPIRLLAAEITREKMYLRVHEELPYSAAVETTAFDEKADGSARIEQTIYVERESQRPIILGKGGQTLKWIGQKSREDLAVILDRPIHLFLHVKVDERWADKREFYGDVGLDFDA
jgi:GTP-binding protein Era